MIKKKKTQTGRVVGNVRAEDKTEDQKVRSIAKKRKKGIPHGQLLVGLGGGGGGGGGGVGGERGGK